MQREEERKKEQEGAIRRAVHSEWERQRFMEMTKRQQEKESVGKLFQDARRRQLMRSKRESVDDLSMNEARREGMPQLSPKSSILDRNQSNVSTFCVSERGMQEDVAGVTKGMGHQFLAPAHLGLPALGERRLPSLMDDIVDDLEDVHLE